MKDRKNRLASRSAAVAEGVNAEMKYRSLLTSLPLLMVSLCLPAEDNISRQGVEVLNRHCLSCHGQTRTSALDLRSRESALKGGARGPAVIPGNANVSLLYQAAAHSGELKVLQASPRCLLRTWKPCANGLIKDFSGTRLPPRRRGGQSVWWSFQRVTTVCSQF